MRKLLPFLFLLISCSHGLKYKYTTSKRYIASSVNQEAVEVKRIEISLRDEVLFASGMDSTFLVARLFDEEGQLITSVDPTDLTISTNVDIEAKPFSFKQGVYKAQILPRVKSQSILMRVDWRGKVLSDEVSLETTIKPRKERLIPAPIEFNEAKTVGEVTASRGSSASENATEGFSFENVGTNRIIDAEKNKNSIRVFSFEYLEQARQNIMMAVTDIPYSSTSNYMHSVYMIFPRKQLPIVEQLTGTLNVTLPNGEKIIFNKNTKEIVDGVFTEGPLVVGDKKTIRPFPDLKYKGQGVILRANARGRSPELGEFEKNKIDLVDGIQGSVDVLIINGATGQRCRRPKKDFWEPIDVNPIEFKFATDEEFDKYLQSKCGFSLPK